MERNPRPSVGDYAQRLTATLQELYNPRIPKNFASFFAREAYWVSPNDLEDLGQILLLECQQLAANGQKVTTSELRRILHRMRQRIAREAKRVHRIDPSVMAEREAGSHRRVAFTEYLAKLHMLKPEDLLILELRRCGNTFSEISQTLGMPLPTVHRRFTRIVQQLRQGFVDPEQGS